MPNRELMVSLTDSEWMSLIDKERGGLPPCCANISELRDQIILLAREGGNLPPWNGMAYLRAYRVCLDGHPFTETHFPELLKLTKDVARSMGVTFEELGAFPHEGNGE